MSLLNFRPQFLNVNKKLKTSIFSKIFIKNTLSCAEFEHYFHIDQKWKDPFAFFLHSESPHPSFIPVLRTHTVDYVDVWLLSFAMGPVSINFFCQGYLRQCLYIVGIENICWVEVN